MVRKKSPVQIRQRAPQSPSFDLAIFLCIKTGGERSVRWNRLELFFSECRSVLKD